MTAELDRDWPAARDYFGLDDSFEYTTAQREDYVRDYRMCIGEVPGYALSAVQRIRDERDRLRAENSKLHSWVNLLAQQAQTEYRRARRQALEDAAKEAEHWQRINTSHQCGSYIASAIRALA